MSYPNAHPDDFEEDDDLWEHDHEDDDLWDDDYNDPEDDDEGY